MTFTRTLARVLAFVLASVWCGSAAPAQTRTAAPTYALPRVSSAVDFSSVPQGIAKPCQRATMSAPLPGMLVELLIKSGDQVTKGQILAVMDNRIATAAVNAAEASASRTAEIEHASHALALARSLFTKRNSLRESQAVAAFELEEAKVHRDQAEASLASALESQLQAKRNLSLEQSRLEVHSIRAPFDGEIVRIGATIGSTLTPSDTLLTVVCLDQLEAELHLPLKLFGRLKADESYRLKAFAPVNGFVRARLAFSSPVIDPASKSFRCVFVIDNRDHKLPAGFGVRFDLQQTNMQSRPRRENSQASADPRGGLK